LGRAGIAPTAPRYQFTKMARFLKEYSGTNWIGWLIIIAVLSLPLLWGRAREFSIVWHQALNLAVACVGVGFVGTAQWMTGDVAMSLAVFVGFGVGYSGIAVRKNRAFERIVGGVCLALYAVIGALVVATRFRQP
jgi:hypothetical protein